MKKFAGLLFLLVAPLVFLTGAAEAKTKLKWGSTSVRSGLYANTVSMAGIVNKAYPGDIEITVVETGGYIENLARIQKKSIHLGPADAAAGYANYEGIIDFQGRPNKDLRTLWGGYITPIHVITTKKSGVTTFDGLNGLSFGMNPGTTSGRVIELFLEANGIKPNYKMMGLGASVDAMKSGVIDGWFKAGYKDSAIMDLESTMDINILPIPQKMIDRMNEKYPGQGKTMPVPANLFKAIPKEQVSFAYIVTDFVHKDISEEVVYKIVKAMWENRKALVGNLTALREGNFEDLFGMAEKHGSVPLHPGAIKFYREVLKVNVPDKLLPPELKK
jgi:uncharacterized protein